MGRVWSGAVVGRRRKVKGDAKVGSGEAMEMKKGSITPFPSSPPPPPPRCCVVIEV